MNAVTITSNSLRKLAWEKLTAAKELRKIGLFEEARMACGYAIEFILKSRICIDHSIAKWPEKQEFKLYSPKLNVHKLGDLLALTSLETEIKQSALPEWSVCWEWDIGSRYHPTGSMSKQQLDEVITATETIMQLVRWEPKSGLSSLKDLEEANDPEKWLRPVYERLAKKHGNFHVFAAWTRAEDGPSTWDIVAAAEWINRCPTTARKVVAEAVRDYLKDEAVNCVGAVMMLDQCHPAVSQIVALIPMLAHVAGGKLKLKGCAINGIPIGTVVVVASVALEQ
jgi:hypothetical protein